MGIIKTIYVFGPYASGRTTLARELRKYSYEVFEICNPWLLSTYRQQAPDALFLYINTLPHTTFFRAENRKTWLKDLTENNYDKEYFKYADYEIDNNRDKEYMFDQALKILKNINYKESKDIEYL